jgi:hypothetical protein
MRNLPIILAALLLCGCLSPTAAPSSSPNPIATPTPTASPSPTTSPSPSPTSGAYTNFVLGYRIDLPPPWRRSACLSTRDQSKPPAGDGFVRVPEQDEKGTDIGYVFDVVQVQVHPNPDRLTPERWLALGLIGGSASQTAEPAMLDGRSALLLRPGPGLALAYLVPAADRIYLIGYQSTPNDTSNVTEMDRMIRSFHLLTDQERAGAPSPTAVPARSAEVVADVLAEGFTQLNADLLATVMAPCMSVGLEQAGGTFTPRGAFVEELRKAFAGGLRVTVERRPIENDGTAMFVRATWNAAAEQRRDLYLRRDGDTWSWSLTLTRQPVR